MQLYKVCIFLVSAKLIQNGVCEDPERLPSSSKCVNPERIFLQIPQSSLLQVQNSINVRFESFPEYVIKPGVDSLSFNCSYRVPVLWKIFPRTSFLNLKMDFYAEVENILSKDPFVCYTTTITLANVNMNASGSYTCKVRDDIHRVPDDGFYLYATTDLTDMALVNLVLNSTIEHPNKVLQHYWALIVPCTFKNPMNITTFVTPIDKDGKESSSIELPAGRCYNMLLCIIYGPSVLPEQIELLYRNGGKILCKTQNKNEEEGTLINVIPSQESIFEPPESRVIVRSKNEESYTFICRSREAIELSTDFKFTKKYCTNNLDGDFYKYQAELKITMPPNSKDVFGGKIDVTVTCKSPTGKAKHVWNYLFYNRYFEPIPQLSINIENGVLRCMSRAPSTVNASFVPCATLNDCQMKSQLLYTDQAYQLKPNKIKEGSRSANFNLSKSGISGMGRCVGFGQDIMSIFSVFEHLLALNNKPAENQTTPYVQIYVDNQEVYESEFVVVNCTTPLMLIISHPYWEFEFRNKTQELIAPEYVTESKDRVSAETLIISARIQIPNLYVTGISCTNNVLTYVSPFVWKNGIFIKNAEELEYAKKRVTVPIKVDQRPTDNPPANHMTAIIGTTFGILFIIASAIVIATFYYFGAVRRENKRLRQKEIDQFRQGNSELIAPGSANNPQNVAYDESMEINPDELDIDYQCVLGSGQFGIVYKGTTNSKTQPLTVAVKALKPGASGDYVRAMMAELKIMLYVKNHSNIISLIGACTTNLIEHQLFVVLDFCTNGDLHTYLRRNTEGFLNFVTRGIISHSVLTQTSSEQVNRMTTINLIQWSFQIAKGMTHIAKLNVIHGDLAARNVLLDENLVAKISDFGLSKKLYQYSLYVRKRAIPVPWRWLAVESLAFTEFSSASDVWSYGVTLWEIFSLGTLPYPGQEYDRNFIKMLKSGFRLPLPDYATYEIYNMILECFKGTPCERPKFDELQSQLDAMLGEYITF